MKLVTFEHDAPDGGGVRPTRTNSAVPCHFLRFLTDKLELERPLVCFGV